MTWQLKYAQRFVDCVYRRSVTSAAEVGRCLLLLRQNCSKVSVTVPTVKISYSLWHRGHKESDALLRVISSLRASVENLPEPTQLHNVLLLSQQHSGLRLSVFSLVKYSATNCCRHPAAVIYFTTGVSGEFTALPSGPFNFSGWCTVNKIILPSALCPALQRWHTVIILFVCGAAVTWHHMKALLPRCMSSYEVDRALLVSLRTRNLQISFSILAATYSLFYFPRIWQKICLNCMWSYNLQNKSNKIKT